MLLGMNRSAVKLYIPRLASVSHNLPNNFHGHLSSHFHCHPISHCQCFPVYKQGTKVQTSRGEYFLVFKYISFPDFERFKPNPLHKNWAATEQYKRIQHCVSESTSRLNGALVLEVSVDGWKEIPAKIKATITKEAAELCG